jgi:hypothetical protein
VPQGGEGEKLSPYEAEAGKNGIQLESAKSVISSWIHCRPAAGPLPGSFDLGLGRWPRDNADRAATGVNQFDRSFAPTAVGDNAMTKVAIATEIAEKSFLAPELVSAWFAYWAAKNWIV